MQQDRKTTLNCDIETGVCEVFSPSNELNPAEPKKGVKLLYFTDPICSSCWGIEPQLRKLKQEYGDYFDLEYRMGGLLKSWQEYGGRDVSGPSSVAQHWEEASAFYQMPIDGEVWNEDPLHSSYPAAIAYKAAQLQGARKADLFLRRIKEMVFLEKKNITRIEHLLQAAQDVDLDRTQFERDYRQKAPAMFEEDILMAKEWGVRGFPTIYFLDEDDNRFKVYGSKPYQVYEQALLKLLTGKIDKKTPADYDAIFTGYHTVTLKEFAIFYDVDLEEAGTILNRLEQQGNVQRTDSKAGSIWRLMSETGYGQEKIH